MYRNAPLTEFAMAIYCSVILHKFWSRRIDWSNMSNSTVEGNAWCRRYRPTTTAAARLVCLPHAGGSAPFFLPVAAALSPGVDVVAIQYPGRQDRRAEPPISDMAVLADRIHAVLRNQPELPLTLFGHSLGALVGFEVARHEIGRASCRERV